MNTVRTALTATPALIVFCILLVFPSLASHCLGCRHLCCQFVIFQARKHV
uniref:Uncharacterized protein n=1 Tax=Arundo donax TaxID=35708 RepID=A0A0A9FKV5_ARUDO